MRSVWMGLLLAASSTAWAAPDCEGLDEQNFLTLVNQGKDAIDQGDSETQRSRVLELQRRIPCLTFAPRPRILADYFVLEAILEFASQGDWRTSLDTALRLRPTVDRFVGGGHPMAQHQPSSAVPVGQPITSDESIVYVDGEVATRLPGVGARHLVQVTRDGRWRSRLVADEPLPSGFLVDRIKAPVEWDWWGQANATVGPTGVSQRHSSRVTLAAGERAWVPDGDHLAALGGLVLRAGLSRDGVGLSTEVDVGLSGFARPVGSHAQLALTAGSSRVQLGAGAGVGASAYVVAADQEQGPNERVALSKTRLALPFGLLTAQIHALHWDGAATVGLGPQSARASGSFGALSTDPTLPWRLGLSGAVQRSRFDQETQLGDTYVRTWTWRAGVEIGMSRPRQR
ncbi:MAG: hypothetical protein ACI9MC_000729 [Kiritimatiellia bacterium]|jgi:hypothetical protein